MEESDTDPKQSTLKLGCLKDASIMEVTEYGRVVHAEMSAICDAARLGKAVKDSTLYTTTFPCHNCTKHIISSGISHVIFMEPYPKSKAKVLHEHEIDIEEQTKDRVAFLPFLGISPVKYRDIFQKTRSRKSRGKAHDWYFGTPRPMLDVSGPAYLDNEAFEYERLRADIVMSREARAEEDKASTTTDDEKDLGDSGDSNG